jgi:MerR family transcriptional regulator, light-induced transcriptional regulator
METQFSARPVMLSIAAVERDTGLSKDTLRVWERRYGFPLPERDDLGERSYPFEQVERLRTIKRLLDAGHRPGRLVPMPVAELNRLASTLGMGSSANVVRVQANTDLDTYMTAIADNDVDTLRRLLSRGLSRMGLGRFVLDVVAPLNGMVGDAWMQGRFEVFQEHFYTESVQVCLRNALHHLPPAGVGRPRVLLATVTGEPHGLGLLMAEAILALEGCRCISLGVQTPVWDIVRAAQALEAEVVALSYTGCTNANHIVDGLVEMRAKMPPSIEIWAGGSAPALQRRPVEGVSVLPTLEHISTMLSDWHVAHPEAT